MPQQNANSDLETEFRNKVIELTGGAPSAESKLLIAVSGGPDSLALLLLAEKCFPQLFAAATVDHGLRKESAEEAAFVATLCRELGIRHRILAPSNPISGSIQSEARKVRYALLNTAMMELGAAWLLTAHHADDQLETMLMRLARGSGLDGLSAVRARNGQIIRPLLSCSKTELIEYVDQHDISPVQDPSNTDLSFDRVRMREALLSFHAVDPKSANLSAMALADASQALDWICEREHALWVEKHENSVILRKTDFPKEILRRLLLSCLQCLNPEISPRGVALSQTLNALYNNDKTMIGDILCTGGEQWTFEPAPPRRVHK